MSERYPMPQYEYEDVVKPERRPETFEIGVERVRALTNLIRDDMEIFKEITIGQGEKDWLKIFQEMEEYPEAEIELIEEESGVAVAGTEKDTIEAFWGMGKNFENIYHHWTLNLEYQKAKEQNQRDEMMKIEDEIDKLNVVSVEWQNKVVNTLFALSRKEEGKEFLQYFWSTFENIGNQFFANDPEEVEGSKQGILGLVKAIEIFEKLGFEAYSAYPEQDAIKKIDIWAKKENNILAVQVKTGVKNYVVTGGVITAYESMANYPKEQQREINQRNQLLTSSREYDSVFKQEGMDCEVHAYWLDLPGRDTELSQDPATGSITFPANFLLGSFTKQIEHDLHNVEKGANHE